MIVAFLDIVIAGLLLGGIFAIIAVGLSLQYGVARVFNIAHGEFIMLGAIGTVVLFHKLGISPFISIWFIGIMAFVLGYGFYKILFATLMRRSETVAIFESKSMLASFGSVFVIVNIATLIWGSDNQGYSFLSFGVNIGGAMFAANRLVTLGFSIVIGVVFYLVLTRTRLGKAIRAAAQDHETASLMGVDINKVLALCFGLGAMMAGLAGCLLSMCYLVNVNIGLGYSIIAMIVITLGGLGSITGSFFGWIYPGNRNQFCYVLAAELKCNRILLNFHYHTLDKAQRTIR